MLTANETPAMVNVRLTVAVSGDRFESFTINVKTVADAEAVGMPVIAPLDAFSESPAGRVPLTSDHVYGIVPPVAVSAAE